MTPTPEELAQAKLVRDMRPFMITYIAKKEGYESIVTCAATMHRPNKLARDGWTVFRVQ
jgi:hypothetical protein